MYICIYISGLKKSIKLLTNIEKERKKKKSQQIIKYNLANMMSRHHGNLIVILEINKIITKWAKKVQYNFKFIQMYTLFAEITLYEVLFSKAITNTPPTTKNLISK